MTNNIETQRPKSAFVLIIVGILTGSVGALCSLTFLLSYLTDPIQSNRLGSMVAAQFVCPVPLLVIGSLLLAGGIYLHKHPEMAPARTKTVPTQSSAGLSSAAQETKPPAPSPRTPPPTDPKITSLVDDYVRRLRATVWTNEIVRVENEIIDHGEKALPVIETTLELLVANGSYPNLQSGTSLVGLIGKIDAPKTVDLLGRIARRNNPSPKYEELITYTCIGELAKMAANGREDAKDVRDSLAQEFSSLVPKINKSLKSQNIPPIEING